MSMKTWDRAPSSPAEEQLRKVQDLFLKNGFQGKPVIELPEFVAAMTAPDSTIWAPMSVEAAQALFKEIDVTNNGFISKAKYTHYATVVAMLAIQDKIDTYNDVNSTEEITQFAFFGYSAKAGIQQPEAAKLWNAVDKDGSGLLSLAEFRTWAAELQSEATLKKLDADEDAMVEE